MNTIILPDFVVTVIHTPEEQWFDGFHQYADDVRSGDYCSAEELAAMTPQERKGYRDAIDACDYAEWSAYRESTNAYGDRTEW